MGLFLEGSSLFFSVEFQRHKRPPRTEEGSGRGKKKRKEKGSNKELEVTFNVKMEERAAKEEVDSDETPSGEAN